MFHRRSRDDMKVLYVLAEGGWFFDTELMRRTKLRRRRFYSSVDRLIEARIVVRRFEKIGNAPKRSLFSLL